MMTGPDPAGQAPVGALGHRQRPRGTLLRKSPMAGSGGQPSGFFLSAGWGTASRNTGPAFGPAPEDLSGTASG
jgi:hypothetical protein